MSAIGLVIDACWWDLSSMPASWGPASPPAVPFSAHVKGQGAVSKIRVSIASARMDILLISNEKYSGHISISSNLHCITVGNSGPKKAIPYRCLRVWEKTLGVHRPSWGRPEEFGLKRQVSRESTHNHAWPKIRASPRLLGGRDTLLRDAK